MVNGCKNGKLVDADSIHLKIRQGIVCYGYAGGDGTYSVSDKILVMGHILSQIQ